MAVGRSRAASAVAQVVVGGLAGPHRLGRGPHLLDQGEEALALLPGQRGAELRAEPADVVAQRRGPVVVRRPTGTGAQHHAMVPQRPDRPRRDDGDLSGDERAQARWTVTRRTSPGQAGSRPKSGPGRAKAKRTTRPPPSSSHGAATGPSASASTSTVGHLIAAQS